MSENPAMGSVDSSVGEDDPGEVIRQIPLYLKELEEGHHADTLDNEKWNPFFRDFSPNTTGFLEPAVGWGCDPYAEGVTQPSPGSHSAPWDDGADSVVEPRWGTGEMRADGFPGCAYRRPWAALCNACGVGTLGRTEVVMSEECRSFGPACRSLAGWSEDATGPKRIARMACKSYG